MASLYIAQKETFEKLKSLLQGFYLELDENNNPVLLIKLEASLLDSILKGVLIEIVLRNPNINKRSCTLYINDLPKNPFYISGSNFGKEDNIIKGFDEVAIKIVSSEKITMVLYNEYTHPFYTTELTINSDYKNLENWLYKIYNDKEYNHLDITIDNGNYFPENKFKGFNIKINNKDHSQEEKLIILAPEYEESFNYKNYTGNGKHGYHQESSIFNNLSNFFTHEIDFYASPKYTNGNEFTDFIIILNESILIIESKYIISEKKTKSNQAIVKAIEQLNKVEKEIFTRDVNLTNHKLKNMLNKVETIIKICLVNDRIILTDNNTKNITKKYSKKQLPFFISVTSFFQLIGTLEIKNKNYLLINLILNCKNLYEQYLSSEEEIMYIRDFKMGEFDEIG